MNRTLILLATVIVLAAGCATSSHVVTGTVRPSISPDGVRVYSTMPTNAIEIAIVNGTANNIRIASTVDAMKRDAAKLGANGLVLEAAKADYFVGARAVGRAIFVP
jgi:hypothetical protein